MSQQTRPRGQRSDEQHGAPRPVAVHHRDDVLPESEKLRESFFRWGRVLFFVGAFYLVVQLLSLAGGVVRAIFSVVLYVIFGGIIALIVAPIDRTLRRVMPTALAAILALLSAVLVVAAFIYFIGQPIVGQANSLAHDLPKIQRPFLALQQTLAQHGINVSIGQLASVIGIKTGNTSTGAVLVTAVSVTVQLGIDLVITLVTAFWLLNDRFRLRRGLLSILPGPWRTETDFILNAFVVVFGGYIRGQLVLAAVVGTAAGIGCWLLGVPFPLVVGVAAAIFELIPLAGPFVGAAVAAIFALTVSPTLVLEVLALFLVIHIIEGYVISPRIQGRFVQLHPLVSFLALLIGIFSGGFLGAFFAVPVASLIAVIARASIADVRDAHPDLFLVSDSDVEARLRRRALLSQYRLNAGDRVRRVLRRVGSAASPGKRAGANRRRGGSSKAD